MPSTFFAMLLSFTVSATNPSSDHRTDVPVVINIPPSEDIRSVHVREHPDIPWQLDDMDGDGHADELVLMLDMKPLQTLRLTVDLSTKEKENTVSPGTYAYIRLNDKNKKHPRITAITFPGNTDNRQMYSSIYGHGAVLEGMANAIRVYMDNRQSVDLYAKNTPRLELEETGFYTTKAQLGEGYGRDILWAGTSVALGSFRGWTPSGPATIDSVSTRGQRIVTTGPLRSVIEVSDRGWVAPGHPSVDMTQRYTIYKGHRDYEVDIKLSSANPSAVYCTGIQKLLIDNKGFIDSDGLAGSWGSNIPDKGMPELADTLGLGIYVAPEYLHGTLEDELNYLTLLRCDKKGHIRYTFTAGAMRDSSSPHGAEAWFAYLRKWQKELRNPVRINVSRRR